MKRILSLLLAAVLSVGMLAGCGEKMGDPPAEEQIFTDIGEYGITEWMEEPGEIVGCEIVKRQTNEEDKEDIVYCKVITNEGFCQMEYQFELLYNYYDEGGWILDMVTPVNQEEWKPIDFLSADGRPLSESMLELGSSGEEYTIADNGFWTKGDKNWYDAEGNLVFENLQGRYYGERYYAKDGDGLYYLYDADKNKLSAGYDKIAFAGNVTDEYGDSLGSRWRVHKGDKIGFIDDAGKILISPDYNEEKEKYIKNFVCLSKDGITYVFDVNGRAVLQAPKGTYDSFSFYRNGFTAKAGYTGLFVFDRNGNRIANEKLSSVCATDDHISVYSYEEEIWKIYDWNGARVGWQPGEVNSLWRYDRDTRDIYYIRGGYLADHYGSPFAYDVYGLRSAYDAIITDDQGVVDFDGNYLIEPGYANVFPVAGGLYRVVQEDDSSALFDWKGRQRTDFYDEFRSFSENGRYFVVVQDGKAYTLPSPLSEEERKEAPLLDEDWFW